MSLKSVFLVTLGLAAAAPAAQAAEGMPPGGCPQGYVVFDKQTGEGGPPAYRQGDAVTASGVITNTSAGVTEVTLRWGSADGPELGRAAVDANGTWTGLAFVIGQEVADGTHQVFYVAHDRNGELLPGLPYPFAIRVGAPVVAAARQSAPATAPREATPAERARPTTVRKAARVQRPTPSPRSTPAPRGASQPASAEPSQVMTATARPARPEVKRRPVTPVVAARPARPREPRARIAVRPSSQRPPLAWRILSAPSVRAAFRGPEIPVSGARVADRPSGAPGAIREGTLLALALSLLLLGLAAIGARLLGRRGDRVVADEAIPEATASDDGCPIEAELQKMIALERARIAARRDPVGPR